jgi:putative ABC transport system permease protein
VSFAGLVVHNVWARKMRTALTAVAIAIGVMTVVTLAVVTHSLRDTAVAVLRTGKADFTVAQKGVSDLLYSSIDQGELARIQGYPEVEHAVGALIATTKLGGNPLFLQIGLPQQDLTPFGVTVIRGVPYAPNATNQIMLGWRAADSLGKNVGDKITIDSNTFTVTGIFSVGQVFGDSGSMLPLTALQANERKPGNVTLAFVQVKKGTNIPAFRKRIERDHPELATVQTQSDFGRVDRNLQLISAADQGATVLALVIGAIIVMNTMLLSFFERTREFGVLRAVGWARTRIIVMVLGEALVISLLGAAAGVGLAFGATRALQQLPDLLGILKPTYTSTEFWRALYVAAGMAFIGGLYPALRAAMLSPLEALRRE